MGRKKDYIPKEPGQQFEEIVEAQQKLGEESISSIRKSKDRDKRELEQLGHDALEGLRRRKSQSERPAD